jgi:hypothetical protein
MGNNWLEVAFICGCWRVIERYEYDGPVFSGTRADCEAYIERRVAEYENSLY